MFVGTSRANGNPNPCTDLPKILCAHPHLSKEGFGTVLTLAPLTPLGLKLKKLKATFLKLFTKQMMLSRL